MDDKKNEDYNIKMPDYNGRSSPSSRDPFLAKSPSRHNSNGPPAMSNIANSPPLSILAYCLASISMTVTNKYCVSGANWNLNFFYLGIQVGPPLQAPLRFPISLLLVGMIYTSTKALQFLSVPVYTIFKNLTIIVTAYGEVLWFGGSVTPSALFSFGLMVLSSVVAAWADIQHALYGGGAKSVDAADALSTLNAGYMWMGMNVFCTATYLLSMRKVIKKMNFKDWDTMFYNNLLTIPVLFLCSLIFENWSSKNIEKNFPLETRNTLISGMIYSGLATIFISYCSAWCIRVTSSTTYSMVGALNKLPLAVSGLVFFAAPVTFGSVSAIIIGFVSGIVYTWAKVRQSQMNKMALPTSQPVMSASSQSNRDASSS
ncbi:Multidrug resistance efflux transporter EmrE [Glarea lozoyensis ATCC 20868]|uniref:GDP-mannose transporter n=2 Tax=Glarea lozoyensis TaxID=101852 RepID=S3DAC3_GLAL2|nr:Multidrug resistance efflux transporter EmrE [Glarea lozoyensis ATCC 20868]EPE34079.1 Multidrug resistance efflux transporter EmrE [Glarea lozoyensis ATCC 20868]